MINEMLTERAFVDMQSFFAEKNHRPSESMLAGLRSLQQTLTDMARGEAGESYFLSSLDPGVGKSTAIASWLKVYLQEPTTEGIIIGLDRYEEVMRFVTDIGIPEDRYAVIVSGYDDRGRDLNRRGLGSDRAGNAPVLFTTKQQIILRSKGKDFEGIEAFHYMGRPRRIRVWDESLNVGRGLTLERYSLLELLRELNRKSPELARAVEQVSLELLECEDASAYQMPDLEVTLNELLHSFHWDTLTKRTTAETLGILAGRVVTVRKEEKGQVMVDCVEALPEDFKPCLVTDASGRIRETYNLQHQYRGDIVRLPPVESCKRYDALTVYVWRKGSGKQTYRKEGVDGFAAEVAKVILSRPGEEFLVVRSKDHHALESAIFKRLQGDDKDRVRFLTWGKHTATNDHAEVPNVILTSVLHYRVSDYEADARASASLPTSEGRLSSDQINAYRRGEHAHHLLQAICRGKVRKAEGEGCPTANVWIIAPPQTGIEGMLPRIFPGCEVKTWKVRPAPLRGLRKGAFEFILEKVTGEVDVLAGAMVRQHLGVDQSNFRRDVLNNEDFLDALARRGIILEKRGRRPRYYFERSPFPVE